MQVFHGRASGAPSQQRSDTFTGTVWADPIMPATDRVTIANVFFAPGGAPTGMPMSWVRSCM